MAGPPVRPLTLAEADQALILYNELTNGPPARAVAPFKRVLEHPDTWVIGAFEGETLAAMVTLHLLPNALWEGRPYGLIENVVTRQGFRRRGFGRAAMEGAIARAAAADAHKIMLMTGTARGARGFYAALGFTDQEKIAMVLRRD
jgi:GNAT superfamily N-acetyltransferase